MTTRQIEVRASSTDCGRVVIEYGREDVIEHVVEVLESCLRGTRSDIVNPAVRCIGNVNCELNDTLTSTSGHAPEGDAQSPGGEKIEESSPLYTWVFIGRLVWTSSNRSHMPHVEVCNIVNGQVYADFAMHGLYVVNMRPTGMCTIEAAAIPRSTAPAASGSPCPPLQLCTPPGGMLSVKLISVCGGAPGRGGDLVNEDVDIFVREVAVAPERPSSSAGAEPLRCKHMSMRHAHLAPGHSGLGFGSMLEHGMQARMASVALAGMRVVKVHANNNGRSRQVPCPESPESPESPETPETPESPESPETRRQQESIIVPVSTESVTLSLDFLGFRQALRGMEELCAKVTMTDAGGRLLARPAYFSATEDMPRSITRTIKLASTVRVDPRAPPASSHHPMKYVRCADSQRVEAIGALNDDVEQVGVVDINVSAVLARSVIYVVKSAASHNNTEAGRGPWQQEKQPWQQEKQQQEQQKKKSVVVITSATAAAHMLPMVCPLQWSSAREPASTAPFVNVLKEVPLSVPHVVHRMRFVDDATDALEKASAYSLLAVKQQITTRNCP